MAADCTEFLRKGGVYNMYIPMIFFSITIERRKLTPEQKWARYQQKKAIAQWEEQKHQVYSQFPEYCIR
ncbi:hypothetical protein BRIN106911_04135 [Brevibacillus invocatus]